jgi:hypothetical protein
MCVTTQEGMHNWAFIGGDPSGYRQVSRADQAALLIGEHEAVAR